MKVAALVMVLLLTAASPAGADTTAEEFSDYVTRMTRLSHRFARTKASFQEREIFLNVLSRSQEELSEASIGLAHARDAAAAIEWLKDGAVSPPPSCPDAGSVFRSLRLIGTIRRKIAETDRRAAEYRSIRSGLDEACEHGFASSRFSDTDLAIVVPEIEMADGVSISIGTNFLQTLVDAFVSFFNWLFNMEEQENIEQAAQRYRDRSAKTEDMRTYAAAACVAERDLVKPVYESFDRYAADAEALSARMARAPWDRLAGWLVGCLQDAENETVRAGVREAALIEARRSRAEWSATRKAIASIRLRRRVTRKESALAGTSCGEGAELVRSLRAELALISLWRLPADDAAARIGAILAARSERCGGDR